MSGSVSLSGGTDNEKLLDLCNKTYKEQAIWFLNAYWDQHGSDAERVWDYVAKCAELDIQRHGDGNALDEVMAHRFLEVLRETLTVMAMRDRLRKTGALSPTERPKLVPLTHYLLFHYDADWRYLVNTKGDNSEELAEAQRLLDQVVALFQESERQANLARKAEAQARSTEAEARRAEEAAREQEAPFKAAQEEVDAALREVKSQEDARNARTEELKRKSSEGGVVQQNKAKNELAQHLAEDPLPLRKAKITLEAALKKAEKARAPFEAATKRAEAARAEAEAAREAAEEARAGAEAALDEAQQKVAEAEAFLEEVKAKPGTPHGAIWWLERELTEQKKYLPTSKGGLKK